ncbi:MAG: RNA pyrophosphohydrolase [Alphaproteobacteria bacterium]|nr:RNA pyrophosphohydrolase [Alphaproteobacteria bacterium]
MTPSDPRAMEYRPAVGIMLLNAQRQVFVGRRIDMPAGLAAWQMPQGGIDPGETPQQAAFRELKEEVGTNKAEILAETAGWLHYDLPGEVAGRMWGGRYRGQRQKWFALRFTGTDADIDLATEHPEFDAWRWVAACELPELIVPFKRRLYLDVLEEFRACCEGPSERNENQP